MIKREDITQGQFISLNSQLGVIQKVENARDKGRIPRGGDPDELSFEIRFIETDERQEFCESSPTVSQIELVSPVSVEILIEEKVHANNTKILELKKANLVLMKKYDNLFSKVPFA